MFGFLAGRACAFTIFAGAFRVMTLTFRSTVAVPFSAAVAVTFLFTAAVTFVTVHSCSVYGANCTNHK